MKKLLLVLFIMAIASMANAIEIELKPYIFMPSDSERVIQTREGLELQIGGDTFYGVAGYETGEIRFSGQRVGELPMAFAGFGFKDKLTDNFGFFIDAGYYQPLDTKAHKNFGNSQGLPGEGIEYYLEKNIGIKPNFQNYTVEYKGNIGARIGLEYNKQITKRFSLGATCGYRYLKSEEMIQGFNNNTKIGCWHYKSDRDLSGGVFGIFGKIVF